MTRFSHIQVDSSGGIARVILNRPDRRNAFDDRMVGDLSAAFYELGRDPSIRGIILGGAGPAFCAGADLRWMSPETPISETQAYDDAVLLSRMYQIIDECPCPVIGGVHGSVFGGGVGLVAVCDVVVAAADTTFALSEVTLGLVPAVISPFLLRKAGESFLRRYALTGEPFSASVALQFTLVHEVVEPDGLEKRLNELAAAILRLAPQAARDTKSLIRRLPSLPDTDRWPACAQANAHARLSPEATQGLQAFLHKRPPAWAQHADSPETRETPRQSPDAARKRA